MMKVIGKMPKASTFEEILQIVEKSPFRDALIRFAKESKLFGDGRFASKLTSEERTKVSSLKSNGVRELNPLKTPDRLGVEATIMEGFDLGSVPLAVLSGSGLKVVVEAKPAATLLKCCAKASWLLPAEDGDPVVILERDGVFEGDVLGLLAVAASFGKPTAGRWRKAKEWRYVRS